MIQQQKQNGKKCKPLTEEETKVILMVPALVGTMIESQNINEDFHKLAIDTLNKLSDIECVAANRDEKGRLLGVRLVLHNIINRLDLVRPIVEETKESLTTMIKNNLMKNKEETSNE